MTKENFLQEHFSPPMCPIPLSIEEYVDIACLAHACLSLTNQEITVQAVNSMVCLYKTLQHHELYSQERLEERIIV